MDKPKALQVTRFEADVEYQEIMAELRRDMGARTRSEVIRRSLHGERERRRAARAATDAKAGA